MLRYFQFKGRGRGKMATTPKPIGEPRILLPARYGKGAYEQTFQRPDGTTYDFRLLGMPGPIRPTVIILPITEDKKVVAIYQYREAANTMILEIPGGNPKDDQTPEETALMELKEETGMEPRDLIRLYSGTIFWEPAAVHHAFVPYLALGCKKVQEPKLDPTEFLFVQEFPLADWFRYIRTGVICDPKTVITSLLASWHLNITTFNIPPSFGHART